MTFTIWVTLFSISLLGAMSPGPSLAIVAKHTLASGRLSGFAVAWSHAIGIGIYAFATVIGLAVLIEQAPQIFKAITIAGAVYLAYLGVKALISKDGIAEKLASGQKTTLAESITEGFLISLLSPKIMLFFVALFSQFTSNTDNITTKAIIVSTPLVVDGLWYSLIVFLLSNQKIIEKLRSKSLIIDRISGIALLLLAIQVFTV
ncbi:TPA: LysE family translocator, partial [Vibrio cholerae]|nr:LysE family translocator [Vibrio cholerae]